MARSKWLDPRRMAHGISWRWARFRNRRPHPASLTLEPQGDLFRKSVLDHYGVEDLGELDARQRMWADFTLGGVERGARAVEMMGGPQAFQGKRVLDVGCAQGGFVVAAAQAGAREVVGIDVNPVVFETAPLLLADYGVTADLRLADFTRSSVPDELGAFDLILCNDVLEHVTDVEKAIDHLSRMMAPSARLFLEIPNGQAIGYVRSDGHYKLPGITLLDFEDARRWHRAFFPEAGPYDTYFYGSLDFYVAAFSRHGIALQMVSTPIANDNAIEELRSQLAALQEEMSRLPEQHAGKPPDLVASILDRSNSYQTELAQLLTRHETLTNPKERVLLATSLAVTYQVGNWILLGHKP